MTCKLNSLVVRSFVAVTLATLCSTSQAFAQTLRSTIPLQSFSANYDQGGIVINHVTNRIYVLGTIGVGLGLDERAVKVIDSTDNSSVALIPIPFGTAYFMAINTQTNRIYVCAKYDDTLGVSVMRVIDGNTNSIIATIPFPHSFQMVRGPVVDSISNRIYVTSYGSDPYDGIYVIDGNNNNLITRIQFDPSRPAGIGPVWWNGNSIAWNGMAVNPNTHRIYMPLEDNKLLVLDGTNNTLSRVALDFQPDGEVVVNPTTNRIYVSGENSARSYIGVIDGSTNSVVANLTLSDNTAWPDAPFDAYTAWLLGDITALAMGIDTATNRIYKYGYEPHAGDGLYLATIDGSTNTVISHKPIAPTIEGSTSASWYMAVNPINHLIYSLAIDLSNRSYTAMEIIDPGSVQIANTGNITASADNASLNFSNVTTPGTVSVTPIADPATAGEVPGGFAISDTAAYEITKDANLQFTGAVTTCFSVSTINDFVEFSNLRVLHRELNITTNQYELVDRTTSSDFSTRTICATTTSFSPFYIARVGNKIRSLFDRSRAHRAGSTVPVKVQLLNASGANISSAATQLTARGLRMIGGNTTSAVIDSGNANPDSNFRYDSSLGGYIFNLSTRGLAAGRYVLSFYAGGDRSFFYSLEFEVR